MDRRRDCRPGSYEFWSDVIQPGAKPTGVEEPGNPLRGSLQRPKFVGWELEGVEKRINFTWDYPLHGIGLTYTMTPQNKADRLAGKLPEGHHIWLD